MAKLWEVFDGEPFLTNPRLGILGLNPPTSGKKGQKMEARKKVYRKKRNTRRRMRKNAFTVGGAVANPRRRRTYRRRSAVMAKKPRRRSVRDSRRRRDAYRRNPSMLSGFGGIFGNLPAIQTVLFTGVGFVGTPIVEGFASRFIPSSITGTTIGKYAVRIASVIGVTFLVRTLVGPNEARPVAVGGGLYVATTAIAEFAPGIIPLPSMGAYTRPALRSYAAPVRSQLGVARGIAPLAVNATASRFRRF